MKYKHWLILVVLAAAAAFGACNNGSSGSYTGNETFGKDASYALGMNIGLNLGQNLEDDGITIVFDDFFSGLKDVMLGEKLRFDMDAAMEIFESAYVALLEKRNAEAASGETAFLAENSRKPGVIITPSGLQYEVITSANGPKPSAVDTVLVHYEGWLTDGTLFDSSVEWGEPVEINLDGLIQGWTEGIQLMSAGSKYRFYIPSDLGYGAGGYGPIPPYSTLIFEIELFDIL
ncbi:MAG: FKBP-type peptidyl-prolyl cis-trans isomerase [Treponema sp.]|jgi:FKBP-type peptidyl-prolyl cis-trans isomerase|nr:FKBP-type peptidyl-prolyl cis-trans isomerase [Treponema sp.]